MGAGYFEVHCNNPISLFLLIFIKFTAKSISPKVLAPVEIRMGFSVLDKNSINLTWFISNDAILCSETKGSICLASSIEKGVDIKITFSSLQI